MSKWDDPEFRKEYDRQRFQTNKGKRYAQVKARLAHLTDKMRKLKADTGCVVCGESEPVCLDFHHVDPDTKEYAVADMLKNGYGWASFQKEIDKCVVICSNCHRKLHADLIQI